MLLARLQAHAIPLALVDEPPVAVALRPQLLARVGIAQARDRGGVAVGRDPGRQDARQLPEPVDERRRVGEDVHALLARRRHHLDRPLPAAVGRAGVVAHVQVRDLGAGTTGPRDLEELRDRVQDPRVAVPDVARVDPVVLARDRVQPYELGRRRLTARVELEPGRHPERPRLHRLVHEAIHQRRLHVGRM